MILLYILFGLIIYNAGIATGIALVDEMKRRKEENKIRYPYIKDEC